MLVINIILITIIITTLFFLFVLIKMNYKTFIKFEMIYEGLCALLFINYY